MLLKFDVLEFETVGVLKLKALLILREYRSELLINDFLFFCEKLVDIHL